MKKEDLYYRVYKQLYFEHFSIWNYKNISYGIFLDVFRQISL